MQSGADSICHYADDFLFIGGKNGVGKSCKELLECFQDVCRELRVPLAEDKTIEPTTCLTFLGLKIDSAKQMVSVPEEKILGISEKISAALNTPRSHWNHCNPSLAHSLSYAEPWRPVGHFCAV